MHQSHRMHGGSAACLVAPIAIIVLLAACGGSDGGGTTAPPQGRQLTLSVTAGASLADTVQSADGVATVKLKDGTGAAVSGRQVSFAVERAVDGTPSTTDALTIAVSGGASFGTSASATTDASGQASVTLRYGSRADSVLVVATTDSATTVAAHVRVLAGNVVSMPRLQPWAGVLTGDTLTVPVAPQDRLKNVNMAAATFSAGSAVTVDGNGVIHAGTSPVYSYVLAQVGAVKDSVTVSVVPNVTVLDVAPRHSYPYGTFQIALTRLDGRQETTVVDDTANVSGMEPAVGPEGVVYYVHSGRGIQVRKSDGSVHALLSSTFAGGVPGWPQPTPDGTWVYYINYGGGTAGLNYLIYRVHADGSGAEQVGPGQTSGYNFFQISMASDGASLLASYTTSGSSAVHIGRMDLSTFAVTDLALSGHFPSLSPDGKSLAYQAPPPSKGVVVAALGSATSANLLSSVSAVQMNRPWTSDGAWLLVNAPDPMLVRVSDGTVIPLLYLTDHSGFLANPGSSVH